MAIGKGRRLHQNLPQNRSADGFLVVNLVLGGEIVNVPHRPLVDVIVDYDKGILATRLCFLASHVRVGLAHVVRWRVHDLEVDHGVESSRRSTLPGRLEPVELPFRQRNEKVSNNERHIGVGSDEDHGEEGWSW
jgi:hypothetical protein